MGRGAAGASKWTPSLLEDLSLSGSEGKRLYVRVYKDDNATQMFDFYLTLFLFYRIA